MDSRPYLIPIEPSLGRPEALIFIDGYLSNKIQRPGDNHQWWEILRQVGWKGSIYYLCWDASKSDTSLESLAQLGVGAIGQWQKYKSCARRVGKSFLPKLACSLDEDSVSFISFSLGAYVAYYAMQNWFKASVELDNVLLLAGAIRRDRSKDWGKVASRVGGKLINVYNSDDWILKRFCQILEWERSPCGIKPICEEHPHIINVNATDLSFTAQHARADYFPVLKEIVEQKFWQI